MSESKPIRVVMSIGLGRLHLVQSAKYIAKTGVDLRLICGWVPKNANSWMVRLASWVSGRNLSPGLSKRLIPDANFEVRACAIAESIDEILRVFCRLLHKSTHCVSSLGWRIFGFASRKHIKEADIFHCRSGAGQGGAIKVAREQGMKILVDHSALYPAETECNLKDDYARWNQTIAIAPGLGVWINVEQDCKEADIIMVNADHIKDAFVKWGYDESRIRVAYLGVRNDFFRLKHNPSFVRRTFSSEGELRILFTGGFSILKGAEYFLDSLGILLERGIKYSCDVIGSVVIPPALKKKYDYLPVTYHGVIPQDELKTYLANADIFLFPSLADGCAQAGMEALAAGVCVVATRTSGLPIHDGEDGFVVPMKNSLAMADKLQWLSENPDEMIRVGERAADMIATKYTWEQHALRVKEIYQELLAND